MALLVLLVGFGRVVYEKQRHFHGLAYRLLNGQQALLAQLELQHKSRDRRLSGTERLDDCRLCGTQRSDDLLLPSKLKLENLEQLFFIPQDFSTSIAAAPEENDPKEGLGREVMVDYFDLLPDL